MYKPDRPTDKQKATRVMRPIRIGRQKVQKILTGTSEAE